jgi:hypothetical protein
MSRTPDMDSPGVSTRLKLVRPVSTRASCSTQQAVHRQYTAGSTQQAVHSEERLSGGHKEVQAYERALLCLEKQVQEDAAQHASTLLTKKC